MDRALFERLLYEEEGNALDFKWDHTRFPIEHVESTSSSPDYVDTTSGA